MNLILLKIYLGKKLLAILAQKLIKYYLKNSKVGNKLLHYLLHEYEGLTLINI